MEYMVFCLLENGDKTETVLSEVGHNHKWQGDLKAVKPSKNKHLTNWQSEADVSADAQFTLNIESSSMELHKIFC